MPEHLPASASGQSAPSEVNLGGNQAHLFWAKVREEHTSEDLHPKASGLELQQYTGLGREGRGIGTGLQTLAQSCLLRFISFLKGLLAREGSMQLMWYPQDSL